MNRWSQYWMWRERVVIFDRMLDEAEKAGYIKARRQMSERQARLAGLAQNIVTTQFLKLSEELQRRDAKTLNPAVLARMLEIAVRIERLARPGGDDPDAVATINVHFDIQKAPRHAIETGTAALELVELLNPTPIQEQS